VLRSRSLRIASLLAVASVGLMYGRTLGYGLYWDDFVVLRPWSVADVAAAFTGPYRPWNPSIAFYRPLTSVYYAALSWLWGWHAAPMHVLPLVGVAVVAILTATFVARETGRAATAGVAAVLIAVHPTLVASLGPWIANQYHTGMLVALVTALLIWQRARNGPAAWWWHIAPWLIAAAWMKEDGLLLPLAFIGVHALPGRPGSDVPPLPRRGWLALVALSVALIVWRGLWLPTSFGYGWREAGDMLANFARAPRYVLLWQVGPTMVAWPAMAAKALGLAAMAWVLLRARRSPGARLIAIGLVLLLAANLPLAFVSSEGRWHLVGWSAVLMLSGALGEWIARAPRAGWAASAVIVVALAGSGWERMGTFAPCATAAREHYREMGALPELPAPLRDWLNTRDAACASGTFTPFATPMSDLSWPTPSAPK
jgi:hypothetical protein